MLSHPAGHVLIQPIRNGSTRDDCDWKVSNMAIYMRSVRYRLVLVGGLLALILMGGCAAPIWRVLTSARTRPSCPRIWRRPNPAIPRRNTRLATPIAARLQEGGPFYDNRLATEWLCRSAQQGYAPAQYRLGQVYSGDMVDGVRILRRVVNACYRQPGRSGGCGNLVRLAAEQEQDDAAEQRDEIVEALSDDQRQRYEGYVEAWQSAPCRWDDVYVSE